MFNFLFSFILSTCIICAIYPSHQCLGECHNSAKNGSAKNVSSDHACCDDSASKDKQEEKHKCSEDMCFSISTFDDTQVVPQSSSNNQFESDGYGELSPLQFSEHRFLKIASIGDRASPHIHKSPIYLLYQKLLIP